MTGDLAPRIERSLADGDLDAFGALLADDVTWGDGDHPRACRSKDEVLALLASGDAAGASADVVECVAGARGVLCELRVRWPDGTGANRPARLWHVYEVRDGRVVRIRRFDDRASAAACAGVS